MRNKKVGLKTKYQQENDDDVSQSFKRFLLVIGVLITILIITIIHPFFGFGFGGKYSQIVELAIQWIGLPITICGYTFFVYSSSEKRGKLRTKLLPFIIIISILTVIAILLVSAFLLLVLALSSGGGR